ncbi:glycosyltransferase [Shewanella mangrovisoli]|uniref:glycosyltransferase n=1 Tax=Shewanella mangrovisoli TaxID=2864211 RepID=UPI00370A63B4
MNVSKKILFVSDIDLSDKNHAGNKNALLSLASYLGEKNEVHLLNLHRHKSNPACFQKTVYFPRYLNVIKRKIFSFVCDSQKMSSYKSSLLLSLITKILDLVYNYDYVFVEYLELHSSIKFIKYNKRVCDLHDLMHLRKESFHNGGLKIAPGLNVDAREEVDLINLFAKVLVIQDKELEHLRTFDIRSELILAKRSAIKEKSYLEQSRIECNSYFSIGFIGNTADFNIDALEYIYDFLWPRLAEEKNIKLYIAGSVGNKVLCGSSERIECMGFVDNLSLFYNRIDLLINPIRFGSGLKTKNIESFSYGVPVLTTQCGAEGMLTMLGNGLEVFNDEEDFLSKIELIRKARPSRKDIQNCYEKFFGAKACYGKLEESIYDI